MRGMHAAASAQKVIEAMRIHYKHETLGETPAEKAGIQLDLEGNKVEALIRLAATTR